MSQQSPTTMRPDTDVQNTSDIPKHVEVYAKAEWYNPGGSVKDRPALAMILDGERTGRLRLGMRIADAASGNMGIAYATLGTCGTFVGTGRRLRTENPNMQLIGVQPDGPYHALEGVKHLATTNLVPGIYDATLADDTIEVSSEAAFEMARRLARTEGILLGISAAANVVAAMRVAQTLEQGVVVTILCDSATKYLSETFWTNVDESCISGAGI
ncbi:MAG: pyridoxal-phosphate dependent enzyme [Chloroflexota bacterium]